MDRDDANSVEVRMTTFVRRWNGMTDDLTGIVTLNQAVQDGPSDDLLVSWPPGNIVFNINSHFLYPLKSANTQISGETDRVHTFAIARQVICMYNEDLAVIRDS